MKNLLLILLVFSAIQLNGVAYATDGVDSWAAPGAPPTGWQSGMTITVSHSITNMSGTTLQFLDGSSTLTIANGGRLDLASISFNDNTTTVVVESGGILKFGGGFSMDRSSLTVNTGGTFTIAGAGATYSGGTMTIDGTMGIAGTFTNDIAIGGAGQINVGAYFDAPTNSILIGGTGTFAAGTSVLPVELIDFDAVKLNNKVLLNWSTASEINSDYYTIMRSGNAKSFEAIATMEAAGQSNSILHYTYTDHEPLQGLNYYQLIETDIDGATQKSKLIVVDLSGKMDALVAYPNPVTDNANLVFFSFNEEVHNLSIINSHGQIVYSAYLMTIAGENKFSLPMSHYPNDIYLIDVVDPYHHHNSLKIVKK